MMNPRSWLAPLRLLAIQDRLISAQARMIELQQEQSHRDKLAHFREVNAIVDAWLEMHDQPELDMRPELLAWSKDLSDRIAVLEESIV